MNTTAKSSAASIAKDIKNAAVTKGFRLSVSDGILTVTKHFTPGDVKAYVAIESDAYSIVGMLKRTSPGSIWGSTSDGIGGAIAAKNGYFVLNKSGGSKHVLRALGKML